MLTGLGEDKVIVQASSQEKQSNTSNVYADSFPHSLISEWLEANGVEPYKHIPHPARLSQAETLLNVLILQHRFLSFLQPTFMVNV